MNYRSFCSIPINILVNEVYPDTHFGQAHKINGMEKIYIESILSIWVFIILTWTSIPFNDIKSFVVYIFYCDKYLKCKHTYNFKVWGLRFPCKWLKFYVAKINRIIIHHLRITSFTMIPSSINACMQIFHKPKPWQKLNMGMTQILK